MKKEEMISMRLTEEELAMVKTLLKRGFAASRSDLMRSALKEYYTRRLGEEK